MSEKKEGAGMQFGTTDEGEFKPIRQNGWRQLAIAVVMLIAFLLGGMLLIKYIGEGIADGLKIPGQNDTTIIVPAIERIDASACKPGQWKIVGNRLVFTNCAKPVFAKSGNEK